MLMAQPVVMVLAVHSPVTIKNIIINIEIINYYLYVENAFIYLHYSTFQSPPWRW